MSRGAINSFPLQAILWLVLCTTSAVTAGELAVLPTTERGFQDRIQASIRPGDNLEDALRLLESQRFECREFNNKNPVIHCSRMEQTTAAASQWLYQVMIEPKGSQVRTATPSLGKFQR